MIVKTLDVASSFFARRLTRQVRELYASTLILDFAVTMVSIFEPVFLYNIFIKLYSLKNTLELVLGFYLIIYLVYFFCIPLGARFAKRVGYENSIALSSVFHISLYLFLFLSGQNWWFIAAAIVSYVFAKMFYWPAYHGDFAKFAADGEQGREISNLWALEAIVFILGPLIGGFIIQLYGFKVLFVVVSLLILASNIPMLATKEKFKPHDFSFKEAFRKLFAKEHRGAMMAHFGYGEELIVLVLWPIFMFTALSNFLGLGLLSAISTFVATIVLLFIGKRADQGNRGSLLRYGTVFYIFAWLIRLIARSPFSILVIDAYSRIAKQAVSVPIMASVYHHAQNGSTMSTIVFFEMSLVIGKILAILSCLILLQFFAPGWNVIFIAGAMFSLFYLRFRVK